MVADENSAACSRPTVAAAVDADFLTVHGNFSNVCVYFSAVSGDFLTVNPYFQAVGGGRSKVDAGGAIVGGAGTVADGD